MAHHLPLAEAAVNPLALAEAAPTMRSPRDVGRWYAGLVRSHSHEVAEGLRIISATEGGTLFHCAAGKDRTGILAAIVLTLLGADRDLIVADYAQTQQNLQAIFARLHKAPYSQPPVESDDAARQAAERAADFFSSNHPLLAAAPESMEAMLEDLGGAPGVMDLLAREADVTTIVEDLQIKLVG